VGGIFIGNDFHKLNRRLIRSDNRDPGEDLSRSRRPATKHFYLADEASGPRLQTLSLSSSTAATGEAGEAREREI
jgi:hypothetical protein